MVAARMCLVVHLIENVLSFFAPQPLGVFWGHNTIYSANFIRLTVLFTDVSWNCLKGQRDILTRSSMLAKIARRFVTGSKQEPDEPKLYPVRQFVFYKFMEVMILC